MKEYKDYTSEELIKELQLMQNQINSTKLGLVWDREREPEEIVLKCSVNLPILKRQIDKQIVSDRTTDNLLIMGDNYHSLNCLNYTHKGRIDVIYIDPPYNTGAKDWKYNNSFVTDEDGYRHSKWLNMMEKRLILASNLLKEDGVLCVTIDNYELPNLWLLLNKIFGSDNFLGIVTIRNNPKGRMTKREIAQVHEFALYFGKSPKASISQIYVNPDEKSHNYVQDENGEWYLKMNLRKQGVDSEAARSDGTLKDRYFPIYFDPETKKVSTSEKLSVEIYPIDNKGYKRIWRRDQRGIQKLLDIGELWCDKVAENYQVFFKFKGGLGGEQPKSIWDDSTFSASEYGTTVLEEILGAREKFPYPKSLPAVMYSLAVASDKKDALILDFFAGSGTTGHAVLEMNRDDEGDRRFILCTNNENDICLDVTYPRIRNIIIGYDFTGKQKTLLYEKKITASVITKNVDKFIEEVKNIEDENVGLYKKIERKAKNDVFTIYGINDIKDRKPGLGGNLQFFETELVKIGKLESINDEERKSLSDKAGQMIAIKEESYQEIVKNDWYQLFEDRKESRFTAVYFREDLSKFDELIELLGERISKVYIFSYGIVDKRLYSYLPKNVAVDDIPEPIIDIYKELNLQVRER